MLAARIRQLPTRWIAASAIVVWLASGVYMFHFGASWHLDLRVYREAGRALYHGGSPFTTYFTANHLPFTYTPFALVVLSPLSFGRLGLVETLWWLISAASLVGAAALMLTASSSMSARRAWAVAGLLCGVASLALEPVRSNFDYGQINLILMVMIVADLTRVRPPWRGVLIGLAAALKLTPLVFLFYFVVAKQWRSLVRGIGVFVGATAVCWAILPSDSARYWLHEVTDAARTGALGGVSNQSWNGMLHRPPFNGGHLGTAMWLVLASATLVCGLILCRWLVQEARTAEAVFALVLTELLVSPVSWTHHWSWLVLVPIVAASMWMVHRVVAVLLLVLLGLAVVALYLWIHVSPLSYVASNALVLGAAATLVTWLVAERIRRSSADGVGTASEPPSASPLQATG